jgi:hypothetical protein
MKAQLLQDIGESHTNARPPNAGTPRVAAPAPTPAPLPEPEPPTPTPTPTPRVWSHRVEPEWRPPETPPLDIDPAPTEFNFSAFAGGNADGAAVPPQPAQRTWLSRWGRIATWCIALVIVGLVAGGAFWLYNESKIDQTMSMLAKDPLPPRHTTPPPAVTTTPPAQAIAPAIAVAPPAEEAPRAEISAPPQAPAAVPQRTSRKLSQKTAPASVTPEPDRAQLWAETLKQCRAAGYHAAKCARLGCTTTKYGLSCKGSPR